MSKDSKEEKQKKDVKALIDGKMDAYGMTKKTLYSMAGLFGCLVLTIVLSITGAGFNPEAFLTWNYWVNFIIQLGISVFSMITGEQMGDDTQRNKPSGQFRRELKNYKNEYDRIDNNGWFDYFEAWLVVYREKKLKKKILDTLRDFGIRQKAVLDLDRSEIANLSSPYKKNWEGTDFYDKYYDPKKGTSETTFLSLSETQIEALEAIMDGYVKVADVSASYFMDALKNTSVDEWERAAEQDKKKGLRLATGYTYRLLMMLVFALITNGLVPSPYEDANGVALNIATRIFVLITSVTWGVYLGFKIVEMDIIYLAYKKYILKLYADESEKGIFKHESIEEEATRKLEEHEKSIENAKKSVVTPDVEEEKAKESVLMLPAGNIIGTKE